MPAKLLLLGSAVVMAALGGLLIGPGLRPTPVGGLIQGNALALFVIGALTGIFAWAFVTLVTLSLCSEIVFVTMGNEPIDSLTYLLSALLIGTAGDLKLWTKARCKSFGNAVCFHHSARQGT